MNSGYEIEWSDQARNNFNEIIKFLSAGWDKNVVKKFVRNIDKELIHIKTFPYGFPMSQYRDGVRRCVVSKINTIYYTVQEKTIYIIAIEDNRRDPSRLKNLL